MNSRGLGPSRETLLFDHGKTFDFCLIQETLCSNSDTIAGLSSRWRGASFWSPAIGKQGGVAVLVNENVRGEVLSCRKDTEGRILSLLVSVDNFKFNLLNIYAPTNLTSRKAFFDNLHTFSIPADAFIVGGDFNCYDRDLDKFGGNVSLANYLTDFKSTFSLVDIWRKLHSRSRQVSWFNHDFSIGARLDKFFVSRNIADVSTSCEISPCFFSDHDFVLLRFNLSTALQRGPGLWKFNNSLISDPVFCAYVSDRIADLTTCRSFFPLVKQWWDFFKKSLESDIISFAKNKHRLQQRERVLLTNRVIELKQRLVNGDRFVSSEIAALKSQLQAIFLRDLEGVKVRSKVQWIEQGGKPTRFFFKLERESSTKNHLDSILDANGTEVFTRDEIERAHVRFYTTLFSAEPINPEAKQFCFNSFTRFLPDPDRRSCDEPISLLELTNSVKTLNQGKSPGPDGLTVEFYLRFWDLLGPLLLLVSEECLADGSLSESMQGTATRLIYKKRGDIKNLKNWRPISLLNVDYKIISKVITLRLSSVLHHVIDPDQTCSVPGRSIFSNLFLLRDIFYYIELTDEPAILVSLDQEKAFDRVDRTFLMDLLCDLGFGPVFCKWIQTFYFGAHMRIILNGYLTEKIFLRRGVRQGDPLSPLLYVICVEALANLVRSAPNIHGFLLPGAGGKCAKTHLYADDTTVVLKDFPSLVNLFAVIAVYEAGSGARLNKSKTEAMWLGMWKHRSDMPLGLTWVRKMKILGIIFGTVPVLQDNWQPKLNKLEKSINLWKAHSLSLVGKSLIINVLGISKFLYLAKVLIIPPWVISRVNQLIWPFIWGSRIETVSRATCFLKPSSDGFGLCNLTLKCDALMLSALVTVVDCSDDSSFFLCKYFVGRRLSTLRPQWRHLKDNSTPSATSLTPYYTSCLETLTLLDSSIVLSSKKIYDKLLSFTSSPPILPRWWFPFMGSGFSLSDHWSLVHDGFCENYKNDVLWLILLRGVKVRDSLKRSGYIDNDRCASCTRRETIDHCFINCKRVKRVWKHFASSLTRVLGVTFSVNLLFIFFFKWPSVPAKRSLIAQYMVKSILYGIWNFRNRATFHNGTDDHRAIIKYVIHDIKNRLKLDFFCLSEAKFFCLWLIPGFCTVRNGHPCILI